MKKSINFFFPVFVVFFLIFGIIIFPKESIESAKYGFKIWYEILVPSLLPFIIGANLIVELKIVDIIGHILNPITKILFKVSGKSALVFVISMFSGYPVGTKLASELRNKNEISHFEAQRLVSFCSTSGPLFIIGSVATGMFLNETLGYLMLTCHYLGALTVGLLFRNYGNNVLPKNNTTLKQTIKNTINSRNNSKKGFFVLFGNAVFNGMNTLIMVCGFVIVFSVVFKILSLFNIINITSNVLYFFVKFLGVSKELIKAFISGLFEITIGCSEVSKVSNENILIKASVCSFLIAFSGLSILAQCSSFLSTSDIKVNVYIFSKFLHGVFASVFTFLLYPFFESSNFVSNFQTSYNSLYNNKFLDFYLLNYQSILPFLVIVYCFLVLIYFEKNAKK